jgi:uncharacterized membrane protein YgcG
LLPSMCGILLHALSECHAAAALRAAVSQSQTYLVTAHTSESKEIVVQVLLRLLKRYASAGVWRALDTCRRDDAACGARPDCVVRFLWHAFHKMLVGFLGQEDRARLMDVYFREGKKVLYRFVIALVLSESRAIGKCKSGTDLAEVLAGMRLQGVVDARYEGRYRVLARRAFKLRNLKRKHIATYKEDAMLAPDESIRGLEPSVFGKGAALLGGVAVGGDGGGGGGGGSGGGGGEAEEVALTVAAAGRALADGGMSVNYISKLDGIADDGSSLLDVALMRVVQKCLPMKYQLYDATLIFTSAKDGCKLATLYGKCAAHGGPMFCVVRPVAVRGEEDAAPLAGAFSSVPFHPLSPGVRIDTRNPDSRLFRLRPDPASFEMVEEDAVEVGAEGGEETEEEEEKEGGSLPSSSSSAAMTISSAVPSRRSRGMRMTSQLFQVGVPATARIESSGLLLDTVLGTAYCGPCDVYGGVAILGRAYERFTVAVVEVYGLVLT